jgi:hypothetical protein
LSRKESASRGGGEEKRYWTNGDETALEESDEEAQCEEGVPSLHCELSNGEDGEDAKLEGKPAVYTCEGGEVNVLVWCSEEENEPIFLPSICDGSSAVRNPSFERTFPRL